MTNDPSPSPVGGGCLLALCIFVGAVLGVVFHQISAGIVIGAAAGALIATGLWWRDRKRR